MENNKEALSWDESDFNKRTPHLLVVDSFYKNPDAVREFGLSRSFSANEAYYKGKRTVPYLFHSVKEEFERLLNVTITDWLHQPANGMFQMTSGKDPLVWHSDTQDYAAAIYLTPDAENMGTSFWKDKTHGCRRPANHPLEGKDGSLNNEVYTQYNITHPDNWELIDRVGAVYNRLVLWDAQLIHSASMYGDKERLVQLYFFSIQK